MSKRNTNLYLEDIRGAVEKIEDYTRGLTYEKFRKADQTIEAVMLNLMVIGEAASHIPTEFKERYQDIPWGDIVGMRNNIVHAYFGIVVEVVWKTIQEDLPVLKQAVEKIKSELV